MTDEIFVDKESLIQYRFQIGIYANRAWLQNDDEADEFAKFIGAKEWWRDTMMFKVTDGDMHCMFEADIEDLKNNNYFFNNVKIRQVETIKK